jgi:hypothetical protein
MKLKTPFLSILFLLTLLVSCEKKKVEYYENNQDQFTFLILDEQKVKTFFERNKDLSFQNPSIKKTIQDSLVINNYSAVLEKNAEKNILKFSKNLSKPTKEDFELSQKVINSALHENNEEYFSACIDYLFFYQCLPKELKHKWTQSSLGHFEFNSTFFSILRDNSKELDKLIYGDIGNWDKNLEKIFQEPLIFNEITPEIAIKIKQTILTNDEFNDERFKQDKLNFLQLLENTSRKKWRLILIDWN